MYNHLLLSTVCVFLSLHSLNTPPLCLPHPLSHALSFTLSHPLLSSVLSHLARDQEARGCCHVDHVFPATSCLSLVSASSREARCNTLNSPTTARRSLTPRILLIVLLLVSTCMYECVCTCMYMCTVCVYVCVCIHVLKYVYRCARVCMCVLIRVIQSHSPISS